MLQHGQQQTTAQSLTDSPAPVWLSSSLFLRVIRPRQRKRQKTTYSGLVILEITKWIRAMKSMIGYGMAPLRTMVSLHMKKGQQNASSTARPCIPQQSQIPRAWKGGAASCAASSDRTDRALPL